MGKRKKTRFPGVQQRESESRRHNGRPDICYTIDYKDETGKRVRKDVGWASQGFTAALAAEIRAKLIYKAKTAAYDNIGPKAMLTFKEAWEKYQSGWLAAQGKNVERGESIIRNYLTSFLNTPLDKITPYQLENLMGELRQQGLSNQTIRIAIGLIRSVMRKMTNWGFYSGALPFDKISLPKLNNERDRFLSPEEATQLLDELSKKNNDIWLMALISLHCGLRFGEIARLRWEDIHWDENTIFIPISKNGYSRHAVMTETIRVALDSRKQEFGLIFPDTKGGIRQQAPKIFYKTVNNIGLNGTPEARITDRRQRVCFHTLRHTYASWLAKSGQAQLTIADRLGHRSLAMTKRYTHLMDETRRASAEAIDQIFHTGFPGNQ